MAELDITAMPIHNMEVTLAAQNNLNLGSDPEDRGAEPALADDFLSQRSFVSTSEVKISTSGLALSQALQDENQNEPPPFESQNAAAIETYMEISRFGGNDKRQRDDSTPPVSPPPPLIE